MRRLLSYILVFTFTIPVVFAQVKIEKPTLSSQQKAFAIIIDKDTYIHTKNEVKAYQQVIENDGLPTYIISGSFERPEDVKKVILKLYNTKQSLEGVVFIGEIPVPMIRNAQHMTTAFKMNEEKFAFDQSSVPSDRFFDDLNLTFKYIKRDPQHKLNHYYKLLESSPQSLHPSIYSARIRYPKAKGGDAYAAIAQYLQKVVRTRRDNILDHFVGFTGAAYNSECLVAWKDDLKAYKEDFPYIGNTVNSLKQLNFRGDKFMKFKIFEEMQRPEVDVFLMRKHGTPTIELINNSPDGTSLETRIEALRVELYGNLKYASKGNRNVDSMKMVYMQKYDLASSFFDQLNDPETLKKDSLADANLSIHTQDLNQINTNPLYVILDACYNGSFHEDDYIAGHYIFNSGNTIAAQGNTRNVLQDKWTMNLTGLLSYGVRLGQVHNLNITLENHLFGDPTFHFGTKESSDLIHKLSDKDDTAFWKGLLEKDDPIYQSIALRRLAEVDRDFSNTLLHYFQNSAYRTVRLQALNQLAHFKDANFLKAVELGLQDEYEMIARQSVLYAGEIGAPSLIPIIANVWVNDKSRKRVQSNLESNFTVFNKKKLEDAIISSLEISNRADKLQEIEKLQKAFKRKSAAETGFEKLQNKDLSIATRMDLIRNIRNSNYHENIDAYLLLLNDGNEDLSLRVTMAEALGWFNHSIARQKIIESCVALSKKALPTELKAEILQTLNRLKS